MKLKLLREKFEQEKAKVLRNEKEIRPTTTFQSWYEEWFEKCKAPQLKSEASRRVYDRKIRNTFCTLLGSKDIEQITQLDIQDATNHLFEKGYTDRCIKEALAVTRECFEIAIVNRIVLVNPCKGITLKNSNLKPKKIRVLDKWEQEMFLNEVNNDYYYEPYKILLLTGMRIGEFSGLQWQDIDWNKKIIHINRAISTSYINGKKIEELTTPKTSNSYRSIPFFDDLELCLKNWKKKQDEYKKKSGDRWRSSDTFGDLVFTSTMGSPVTRYVLAHDINRIVQNMRLKEVFNVTRENRQPREIRNIHPHVFRHTFATRCFEKGVDPVFVQSIMGHANYNTTLIYTHLLDEKKMEERNKISDLLR